MKVKLHNFEHFGLITIQYLVKHHSLENITSYKGF
ncbi:hypothetical protein X975_21170, partial [Stegodyphus mimosarum]